MADTKIQWANKVWNPVTGCTKVSEGCRNCYAERMAKRLRGRCGYDTEKPFKVTLHPDRLEEPLHWRKPSMIFVCSMGDLFHEDVVFDYIDRVFAVMALCPQHTFLILTKRPKRMQSYISTMDEFSLGETDEWREAEYRVNCDDDPDGSWAWHRETARLEDAIPFSLNALRKNKCLPNVWLGVTAENQEQADKRIPILLQTPAAIRFVSVEPMLGPVDLDSYLITGADRPGSSMRKGLDWVICGGETGPHARPVHPDWVRNLRDQCQAAGVPFFFKQWGEWVHESQAPDILENYNPEFFFDRVNSKGFARVGKKIARDLLGGKQYHEFPGGAK